MPLLQENTPKRDHLGGREMKVEEDPSIKPLQTSFGYQTFHNPTMFTPSQILMASQLMAATGLTLSANPAFFHPGLLPMPWAANSPPSNSPPSPPASNEPLSPALNSRIINNNNNIVSSSTISESRKKKFKVKEEAASISLPSPTSSVSPPSGSEVKDPNRDKQFTCQVCNRSFGYKHVLQNHERTHTGEKPFECPECHKRFTRDHHLKTHMRLHTGERPYHCDHCDRQFVQVANLRRHLRVHTGERPYQCDHCAAKFSDSNQLKAHLLIHTNEKPFACNRCLSRFRRRHHLLHHKCDSAEGKNRAMTPESEDEELKKVRGEVSVVSQGVFPLPEQTEPEDLSMSTGLHSSVSGGCSPLRSPGSREEEEEADSAVGFLQRRPTSRS